MILASVPRNRSGRGPDNRATLSPQAPRAGMTMKGLIEGMIPLIPIRPYGRNMTLIWQNCHILRAQHDSFE